MTGSPPMERVKDRLPLLESLPKGLKMAELGVFEGVFSREMLLIDLAKSSRSPDAYSAASGPSRAPLTPPGPTATDHSLSCCIVNRK